MNRIRKCVATCVSSCRQYFSKIFSAFLLESFSDGYYARQYALVPITYRSPQKPVSVYRSFPYGHK